MYDLIIIGGGAAGLFAAAHNEGLKGLIIEKNKSPGKKLLLTGAGQCNVTHGGNIKDFVLRYGQNGTKVRKALYSFSNIKVMKFFQSNGVSLFEREDGKVFPKSLKSEDILNCLLKKTKNFEFQYEEEVFSLEKIEEGYLINNRYKGKNILVATGGKTYRETGSNGQMFHTLETLGIEIIRPRAAITPIFVENYPFSQLSGISLKKVKVTIVEDGKELYKNIDDILFTHRGFSGPGILNLSRYAKAGQKLIIKSSEKIPKRLEKLGFTGEMEFSISGTGSLNSAMVTAGGVCLNEVDLKSFECKKHPGLYIVGEALDVDGDTGGYNLQFAFSSSVAAMKNILLPNVQQP